MCILDGHTVSNPAGILPLAETEHSPLVLPMRQKFVTNLWCLAPLFRSCAQPSLLHSHLGTCWCRKGCSAQSSASEQANASHGSQRLSESCLLPGNGGGMKVFGIKEWWPGVQPPMAHFKYYFEPSSAGLEFSFSLQMVISARMLVSSHKTACSQEGL